jgi:polyisoprenoid-binding protein YceI
MRTCPICIVAASTLVALSGVTFLGGAGPAAASAARPAAAESFTVDAVHSSVAFRILHMNVAPFYGRFNKVSGSFLVSGESSVVDVTIDAESVDTANGGRDKHVKSQDFLSVKEFPAITFKSTAAKKQASGDAIDVTGNLTFHGVTKSITVTVKPTGEAPGMKGGTVAGIEAIFSIKRSEYGMGGMPGALGDDVTIMVGLEGNRK